MSKKRNSKSFEIALSAISCALAVIFLLVGTLSHVLLATGYIMAQISLMIPLSKGFYGGDALAYIGTCILTILLGAIGQVWVLVPFIMFFGQHPLLNALQLRFNINKWLAYIIKAVWFDFSLWVMYILVFGSSIGNPDVEIYRVINDYILLFIFIGGTIVFLLYDYVMFKVQMVVNAFIYRIKK
ncbi:MAG TPA: hypothetical protein IAC67_06440 [Candidatus Coproplasma excrementipullorum]|nr:hypothetical protein [Candidatus Coproplasma excrementipullorum]